MILDSVHLKDNFGDYLGGGIFSTNNATVVIRNSTISDNQAGSYGGGIDHFSGSLTIENSTVSGNRAVRNAGIVGGGDLLFDQGG